jgi:hypothetical protein
MPEFAKSTPTDEDSARLEARLQAASERYYELFDRISATIEVTDRGIELLSSTTLK